MSIGCFYGVSGDAAPYKANPLNNKEGRSEVAAA